MKIFFNPEDQGFYHEGVQPKIPTSALQINKAQYEEFRGIRSEGKMIKHDGESFYFEDIQDSIEDLKIIEKSWVSSELERAGEQLNLVQDSDPAAVGTVTSWREYRKALRAWSEHEDFPKKEKRPKSPDHKE